jgi:hypothetical protein
VKLTSKAVEVLASIAAVSHITPHHGRRWCVSADGNFGRAARTVNNLHHAGFISWGTAMIRYEQDGPNGREFVRTVLTITDAGRAALVSLTTVSR